ncbi:hypothetical protein AWJ20_2066 [Sugiyamaella lignohabitans]|uniref:OTU domain-containing protein n=1 Tax=Sugiyamaella lignohabitans TaxID=796027 RepID=A0A167EUH7_9ASCO|nr:uncharacterized protein AWJ20_2066 [Sugiyamaella lignohabitans]ANB14474.1 hypothetical protein AWJ20_2066 [Sugiyamaella lignohabitans]
MAKNRKKNWQQEYGHEAGRLTRSKSQALKKILDTPGDRNNDDEFPVLKRLSLYASSIKGDGNCLFRSFSDQYYGDNGDRHQEVRAEVVNYMKEHSDYFALFLEGSGSGNESWPAYIKRMAKDGVYGDNLEIVAFARRYGVNVMIYQNDFMYVVSCQEDDKEKNGVVRDIHIAYHTWEHYSSVRNLAGPHSGLPEVQPSLVEGGGAIEPSSGTSDDVPKWMMDAIKRSIPYPPTEQMENLIVKLFRKYNNSHDFGRIVEEIIMMDNGDGEVNFDTDVEVVDSLSDIDKPTTTSMIDQDKVTNDSSAKSIQKDQDTSVQVANSPETSMGVDEINSSMSNSPEDSSSRSSSTSNTSSTTVASSVDDEGDESKGEAKLSNINGKRNSSLLSNELTEESESDRTHEISVIPRSRAKKDAVTNSAPRVKRLTAREKKERQKKEAAERKRASKISSVSDRSRSTTAGLSDTSSSTTTATPSTTPSTPGIRTMYI